jgi:hypothetical protein
MNDVVIARYSENLDWIVEIPADFEIYIYNKGPQIKSSRVIARAQHIMERQNVGREAESYLWHVQHHLRRDNHTVFCQGNPFEHSPDFIEILKNWRLWDDVQPCSWQWRSAKNIPPAAILDNYEDKIRSSLLIREEYFSLITWNPLHFYDEGAFITANTYCNMHNLEEGTNIAAHFLAMCKLDNIAESAARHLIGKFSYGGVFAIDNKLIRRVPKESIERLYVATLNHYTYGYVLERLWLHIFGRTFYLPEQTGSAHVMTCALPPFASEAIPFIPFPPVSNRERILRYMRKIVRPLRMN